MPCDSLADLLNKLDKNTQVPVCAQLRSTSHAAATSATAPASRLHGRCNQARIVASEADQTFMYYDGPWRVTGAYEAAYTKTACSDAVHKLPLYQQRLDDHHCRQTLRKFRKKCLNFLDDHYMHTCAEDFLNNSGLLNPDISTHTNCSNIWQAWRNALPTYTRKSVTEGATVGCLAAPRR